MCVILSHLVMIIYYTALVADTRGESQHFLQGIAFGAKSAQSLTSKVTSTLSSVKWSHWA